MKIRRYVSILCVSLAFLMPYRQATAFVPTAAVPVLVTAAGPIAWSVAALVGLVAAGTAIHGVIMRNEANSADALLVRLNPKAAAPVPSGWSAASPASNDPVPPSSTSQIPTYRCSDAGVACSSESFVTSATTAGQTWSALRGWVFDMICVSGANTWAVAHAASGGSAPGSCGAALGTPAGWTVNLLTTGVSCPTGYTVSGGSCTLTSAPAVAYPTDGVGNKKVSAGVIADDPRDPDNTTPAGTTVTDTQITVRQGTSTATIKINGDGTATVSVTTGNGNGTSTRVGITMAPPDAGSPTGGTAATGVTNEQVIGEGSSADEGSTNSGVVTCTNCALEVTQQEIKTVLTSTGIKINETGTPTSGSFTAADTALTAAADAQKKAVEDQGGPAKVTSLGWAFGWTLPAVSCSSWNFTFKEFSRAVEWCEHLGTVRSLLGWFLGIFSALYVWRSASSAVGA